MSIQLIIFYLIAKCMIEADPNWFLAKTSNGKSDSNVVGDEKNNIDEDYQFIDDQTGLGKRGNYTSGEPGGPNGPGGLGNQVSCGGHNAASCSECGAREILCNGDCKWDGVKCTQGNTYNKQNDAGSGAGSGSGAVADEGNTYNKQTDAGSGAGSGSGAVADEGNQVSCGGHNAASCSECGPTEISCNGDCKWDGVKCIQGYTSNKQTDAGSGAGSGSEAVADKGYTSNKQTDAGSRAGSGSGAIADEVDEVNFKGTIDEEEQILKELIKEN